jgi:hypothetical protein
MSGQARDNLHYPIIAKAADLLLKCSAFIEDQNAALKPKTDDYYCETYYAIDNDIIALYLQPDKNTDYMDVFKSGYSSELLSFLLGDFLFVSAQPLIEGHDKKKYRFLIIPPHDEELLRIITAIHSKLLKVVDTVNEENFDALSVILGKYDQDREEQALLTALTDYVPDLVELFNPYRGPKAALTRYARLPDSIFQRLDYYLEDGFAFQTLDPINKNEDRKLAGDLINQWKKRLTKKMPPQKHMQALLADAEVLATIEYINKSLREEKKCIVLITGSNYLFEAADEYKIESENEQTFAELYLRHPQALLAHQEFFSLSVDEKVPFKLIDWLTLFFPFWLRRSLQSKKAETRLLLRSLKVGKNHSFSKVIDTLIKMDKDMHPINNLLSGWEAQIASVAKTRYAEGLEMASIRGASELAIILKGLRDKSDWDIEKLRILIFKESIESISSLYSTTVWVGLWSQAMQLQPKAVPALRFDDDYKAIEKYYSDIVQSQLESARKPISQERLGELRASSRELEKIDTSNYHAHVVHALAFGARGHWYATLALVKVAMAICDNLDPSERKFRLGREAAYLACIAERRSLNDRKGLKKAAMYLEEAIKRENEGSPEDIRFTLERLILEVKSYYFDFFYESKEFNIESFYTVIKGLYSIINKAKDEKNVLVRLWVKRQALTHFFTLLVIAQKLNKNLFDEKKLTDVDVGQALQTFNNVLNQIDIHHHKPDNDPYTHLIYNISTALWNTNAEELDTQRKQVLQDLDNWDLFFMPYDRGRIKFLKALFTTE